MSLSRALKLAVAMSISGCSVITTFDNFVGPPTSDVDGGFDATSLDGNVAIDSANDATGDAPNISDAANANDADANGSTTDAGKDSTTKMDYGAVVLADSPELYWRFDSTTSITDSSGNGHSGTVLGAVALGATPALASGGFAASFNQGAVSGGDLLAFAGNAMFSLEAWVNTPTTSSGYAIISREQDPADGYSLFFSGGVLYLERENSTETNIHGASPLPTGVYSHVVATYDGSTMILYVNGAQVAQGASAVSLPGAVGTPFLAGDNDDGSANRYVGLLDEVAVYDHVLTPARVSLHYEVGIGAE